MAKDTGIDVAFYRVRRVHVQDLIDRLLADGVAPATINTTVGALGAIYSRPVHRDELEVSPTQGVKIPAARNGRARSPRRTRPSSYSPPSPSGTGACGRRPCTPACAAAS